MFRRRTDAGESVGRRLVGLALLLSICASFIPFPLRSDAEKDKSQPFPCQDRTCGCASAEQCWKQCCCFTHADKIAWARQHGVSPPRFVAEAARTESERAPGSSPGAVRNAAARFPGSSSSDDDGGSCCRGRSGESCSSSSLHGHQHAQRDRKRDTGEDERYVVGIEMMKCRGQGWFWDSLPWAVIPEVHLPEFHLAPASWDRPRSVVLPCSVPEPPEPPPRRV
jgi:hypothetical protein